MAHIPDLKDPRYLDEVGWFLYHEKHHRDRFGGSYTEERSAYSRLLLEEVVKYCGQDAKWLQDRTVVTIGCGCTGDLSAWPAAVKIAVDPLLYVYQQLGMVMEDAPGTSPTVSLSQGAEDLPLLDQCADLVLCRNALDHMPHPERAVQEIWRILKKDGAFFLSVDIGGEPTPDEPTVFSVGSLTALVGEWFEVGRQTDNHPPHSRDRVCSVRLLGRKKPRPALTLDRETVLQSYLERLERLRERK